MVAALRSWGRYPDQPQTGHSVRWPDEVPRVLGEIAAASAEGALAYGMGRSYGDSCLAQSDRVVETSTMDRVLHADWAAGTVTAQAGLSLASLIEIALPHGWFLPVTPGTRYVTLGGAVANDVHGKNHHVLGTFGCHVLGLTLYRSDQGIIECSPSTRADLFAATVGGLGLTGIILAVRLQLRRVQSCYMQQRAIRFGSLDEFFAISAEYDSKHEYGVAWVDCQASGKSMGRGIYFVADHAAEGDLQPKPHGLFAMPIDPPFSLINRLTLRVFNALYYYRQWRRDVTSRVDFQSFFYPLDGVRNWNRFYGRRGFQQYQCVVPRWHGREVMGAIMTEIARSHSGSFLTVLKQCGDVPSPGLLSFPMPGVSLALDFPQRDQNTALFKRLDAMVHEAGGRLYPAKDAHMAPGDFQRAYPQWRRVEELRDPQLLSRFWKRVTR